jgi:hypothetical protein
MRRALILAVSMLLLTALPAAAEEHSWTADPPKQVGMPVLWCTATATAGGDTLTQRNYAALDDTYNAEAFQKRVMTDDVVRGMRYAFPTRHEIQPSDVTVTCGGGR